MVDWRYRSCGGSYGYMRALGVEESSLKIRAPSLGEQRGCEKV